MKGYEAADRRSRSTRDVENDSAVHAMAIARVRSPERRRIVLALHGDEPVIAAKTPAPAVPLDAATDVPGEERVRVVDAEHCALEQRLAADATRDVRDNRAARRVDDHVAVVVQQVRGPRVRQRDAVEVQALRDADRAADLALNADVRSEARR